MKKLLPLIVICLILVIAGSCAPPTTSTSTLVGASTLAWSDYVTLKDGRTVLCVFSDGPYSGGVSCDWSKAK